jgi:succinate dehydrogenase/fumarate reductase flavoprotein subunit
VLLHHEVREVRRNARGEVIGVIAATPSGDVAIRARKAVVFGSGGYTHNPELMLNFQPGPIFGGCAVPTNQGDFIRIGALLGAKLGNMVNAWRAQLILEDALRSASVSRDIWQVPGDSVMLVNRLGRRVVDEKRNYHDRTRAHFHWDPLEQEYVNKLLFMVYDQRTAELFAGDYPLPAPGTTESYVLTADALPALSQALATRLEDLEPQIGVVRLAEDFDTRLADQVQRFNADAKAGVDSEFGRGKYPYDAVWDTTINSVPRKDTKWPAPQGANPTLHPLDSAGPFHAIILGAANLDTNGGPMTDAGARVLDANNRPIPGLFGAGNCIAAPAAAAYWGAGATIGPAMTFGTLAGRAAAAEPVKEA